MVRSGPERAAQGKGVNLCSAPDIGALRCAYAAYDAPPRAQSVQEPQKTRNDTKKGGKETATDETRIYTDEDRKFRVSRLAMKNATTKGLGLAGWIFELNKSFPLLSCLGLAGLL